MLTTSVVLFAIAALLGLVVAIQILKNRETSKPVAVIHGLFAATGLLILIIAATTTNSPVASIVLFVIAAIGGITLFTRDLMKKTGPKALVVIHALAAVTAFVILLVFVFKI